MKVLKKTLLGMAVGMMGAMAISQPVAATPIPMTVKVTGMHYSNPTTASIHSGNDKLNVYTGAFDAIIDGKTLLAWCIDISQATIFGQIVNDYGSASTLSPSRIDALARLATEALGLVTDSATSGAFQLAAWEIVNETAGGYDLGTGNFKADNVLPSQNALAQDWLTHLPAVSTYSVTLYNSPTMQDLAVFAKLPGLPPATVPEPATTALLGLGLLGFAASRRKPAKDNKA